MLDLEARYRAVTTELQVRLQTCPDVESAQYAKWARSCTQLGFERLSIVNEMKDLIGKSGDAPRGAEK